MMSRRSCNIGIVGGGIVGMASALAVAKRFPGSRLLVLEKELTCGQHQSTHNSGVLHAGLYYKPGSLKAHLAVTGIRRMTAFCSEFGIAHDICGKVVIATNEEEAHRLDTLFERGTANGLSGLRMLDHDGVREREPHANAIRGLLVPEEGIVDYAAVCRTMADLIQKQGHEIRTGCRVDKATPTDGGWILRTTTGDIECDFLINCAGLHSDRVALASGATVDTRIIPFRGEYYQLKPSARHLVHHLIYPVPDPGFPFLGVHFTRLIGGGIEAGPNAVLAFAREGYRKSDVNLRDLFESASFPGLRRFVSKHASMCWNEFAQSLLPSLFVRALQKLVPEIRLSDLEPGGAGVRAQAMRRDGALVEDFCFVEGPRSLHVVNAPSPAATASLAIGEAIAERISLVC